MYRLVRTRRKTIALVIERDGSLTVRAPLRASQADIERLVAAKSGWIADKQAWMRQLPPPPAPHRYLPGELFYFQGTAHPLHIARGPQSQPLRLADDGFHLAEQHLERAAALFERWYRGQARRLLAGRVAELARRYQCQPGSLRITAARSRWGSCGVKGNLNFSWRLVMAPPAVIDYVIVHELAHLKIRNHSRAFWALVAAWMPDYPAHKAWLKQNGGILMA